MTSINTNISATITNNALTKNDRAMSQAMERLSTGQGLAHNANSTEKLSQ